MRILLDTNILTRSAQPSHPQHDVAVRSVSLLRTRGDALFIAPQNLYEFWVVSTRATGENGLGMSTELAQSLLIDLKRSFTLLHDTPILFTTHSFHHLGDSGHPEWCQRYIYSMTT